MLRLFDPPPRASELPVRLPSPFDPGPPHPLARRAAEQLKAALRAEPPGGERGKMFGVLVVADRDGRVGWLAGFSGMLAGRWMVEGFVEPIFDFQGRTATWPTVEAELFAFEARLAALDAEIAAARAGLAALEAQQAAVRAALAAVHGERKLRRHDRRTVAETLPESERAAALHVTGQESRADTVEERALRAAQREEREAPAQAVAAAEGRRVALDGARAARSSALLEELFAGYQLESARGEVRSLRALFAPASPPGGSGDCAAPKLFVHALRAGLRPLALTEFWWGPSPATGGRLDGHHYPACRGKCGPVLAHLLDGLEVGGAPLFGADAPGPEEPRTVFEDQWLVVVDKPVGLLSVPGRSGLLRDSVLARLQARGAGEALVVHRLDLDTSGLMAVAKDVATHYSLQRQFSRREIAKRYIALVDGDVAGESGTIDLALRVDLDDRPRQIHDPVHGKSAVTEWRVLSRGGAQTRVALHPLTGRTHQLRVHAAHPQGLGVPIVGDRLYGVGGARLMLHAEALSFVHPHSGARVEFLAPAPF